MDKASMDMAWVKALLEDDGDAASMLIAAGSDPHAGICGGASPLERARIDGSQSILAALEPGMRAGVERAPKQLLVDGGRGVESMIGDLIARIESGSELPEGVEVMDLSDIDPELRKAMGLPEGLVGAKVVRMGAPGQSMPEGMKAMLDALSSGQGGARVVRMGGQGQMPEGLKALLDAIDGIEALAEGKAGPQVAPMDVQGQMPKGLKALLDAIGALAGQSGLEEALGALEGEGEWVEFGGQEDEEGPDLGELIAMPAGRQLH